MKTKQILIRIMIFTIVPSCLWAGTTEPVHVACEWDHLLNPATRPPTISKAKDGGTSICQGKADCADLPQAVFEKRYDSNFDRAGKDAWPFFAKAWGIRDITGFLLNHIVDPGLKQVDGTIDASTDDFAWGSDEATCNVLPSGECPAALSCVQSTERIVDPHPEISKTQNITAPNLRVQERAVKAAPAAESGNVGADSSGDESQDAGSSTKSAPKEAEPVELKIAPVQD